MNYLLLKKHKYKLYIIIGNPMEEEILIRKTRFFKKFL